MRARFSPSRGCERYYPVVGYAGGVEPRPEHREPVAKRKGDGHQERLETAARREVAESGLSARAARRVLKVARTIADLAGEDETGPGPMAEALSYRGDAGSGAT